MKKRQKIRQGIILVMFFLFPALFYYQSPVIVLDAGSKGIVNGSLIVFFLMFVSALFLGRGFCGWICPAAGCQEALFPVRSKKVTRGNYIKWLLWVPWVGAIVISAVRAGGYNKIDFFYQTTYGLSIGNVESLVVYYLVLLLLIVIPAFLFGRRSFCHHLCWMAPFMITGRKIRNFFQWSSLCLVPNSAVCVNCRVCTRKCPMSLPVEEMVNRSDMENAECILCGNCVDVCRENAIVFSWGRGPDREVQEKENKEMN